MLNPDQVRRMFAAQDKAQESREWASVPKFAGIPLSGVWPHACPGCEDPLEWAQVPKDSEPYLVCTNPACQHFTNADGPSWTTYHAWTEARS